MTKYLVQRENAFFEINLIHTTFSLKYGITIKQLSCSKQNLPVVDIATVYLRVSVVGV